MSTHITRYLHHWVAGWLILLPSILTPLTLNAQDEDLLALNGDWLYFEDRTEGRPIEQHGPPMSVKIKLRVEQDAVIYARPRGDERIPLDGAVIEIKEGDDYVARYRGEKKQDWLEYTLERVRLSDNEKVFVLKRVFRPTDEGMLVYVFSNKFQKQMALYRHPEDIELPKPAKATIGDMAWLSDSWSSETDSPSMEERWSPPKGGAMLGISRTVKEDKMVAFEYLRIIERDGGLVYVAQPGGITPTEFVLTELSDKRAVFVNPRHDYPQRIIYEVSAEGALTTSIGWAKSGRLQSFTYRKESDR